MATEDSNSKVITFICTGNICRSPMAERLFVHAIKQETDSISSLHAISAGVAAYEGQPASKNAVEALRKCDIDLLDHSSQAISQEIIDKSIFIFCMTETHRDILEHNFDIKDTPIFLMRQFLDEDGQIPDPFGQNLSVYEACRDSMVEAIPSIIEFLKNELTPKL